MSLAVTRKIVVNGKEYHSVDELPPDIRALYVTVTRFILNGREVDSIEGMPPETRELVTDALGGGKRTTSPMVIAVAIAGALLLIALALLRLK